MVVRIVSDQVVEPAPGLWSNCLLAGKQAFISGLVAFENDQVVGRNDPYRQSIFIFAAMKSLVESAGGQMADVVNLNIFVTDMKHRPAVLEARRQFFSGNFPCSTLVSVSALIHPELLVEINAIAVIGASSGEMEVAAVLRAQK